MNTHAAHGVHDKVRGTDIRFWNWNLQKLESVEFTFRFFIVWSDQRNVPC